MNMLPERRRLNKVFPLSKREKKQIKELENAFKNYNPLEFETENDFLEIKDMLNLMIEQGYVEEVEYYEIERFSQVTKIGYKLIGSIDTFNDWVHDQEKKAKRITHREWKISIISAIIGAAIGLIPFIVSLFTTSNTPTP